MLLDVTCSSTGKSLNFIIYRCKLDREILVEDEYTVIPKMNIIMDDLDQVMTYVSVILELCHIGDQRLTGILDKNGVKLSIGTLGTL